MPEPIIEFHDRVNVVRDDLLPGGTKRRGVDDLLKQDGKKFVYASPAQGYAQVALAIAAEELGKQIWIVTPERRVWHPLTMRAYNHGAQLLTVPHGYMTVLKARAHELCAEVGGTLLPFGLDVPLMREGIATAAARLPIEPSQVWCAGGSGCLTRALQIAWPKAEHHVVQVGAEGKYGKAEVHKAPESFSARAKNPPPFPSSPWYDAKVWQFVPSDAGGLFWNVAA